MARYQITRATVDLTHAQRQAVDAMIQAFSEQVSQTAGVKVDMGVREFFHMLLRQHAERTGQVWPEDYPKYGGRRERRQPPTC